MASTFSYPQEALQRGVRWGSGIVASPFLRAQAGDQLVVFSSLEDSSTFSGASVASPTGSFHGCNSPTSNAPVLLSEARPKMRKPCFSCPLLRCGELPRLMANSRCCPDCNALLIEERPLQARNAILCRPRHDLGWKSTDVRARWRLNDALLHVYRFDADDELQDLCIAFADDARVLDTAPFRSLFEPRPLGRNLIIMCKRDPERRLEFHVKHSADVENCSALHAAFHSDQTANGPCKVLNAMTGCSVSSVPEGAALPRKRGATDEAQKAAKGRYMKRSDALCSALSSVSDTAGLTRDRSGDGDVPDSVDDIEMCTVPIRTPESVAQMQIEDPQLCADAQLGGCSHVSVPPLSEEIYRLQAIGMVHALPRDPMGQPTMSSDGILRFVPQQCHWLSDYEDDSISSSITREVCFLEASAGLLLARGEYASALEGYRRALMFACDMVGNTNRMSALIHVKMGVVYRRLGDLEGALASYLESLRIIRAVSGDEHRDTAYAHHNVARLYEDQCDWERALEHYEKAGRIGQLTGYSLTSECLRFTETTRLKLQERHAEQATSRIENKIGHAQPEGHVAQRNDEQWRCTDEQALLADDVSLDWGAKPPCVNAENDEYERWARNTISSSGANSPAAKKRSLRQHDAAA